jgi:hypothetical protein
VKERSKGKTKITRNEKARKRESKELRKLKHQ